MATMASPLLVLLLFSAVACSTAAATAPTIRAQHGKLNTSSSPPASLVQSTCNATAYYDLCVATLVADPSSSTADLRGLCAIAVSAAAANASATQAALANTTSSSARRDQWLFRACAGKYGQARDTLVGAQKSVDEEAYDDAFIEVGAAAEYPSVCRTNFRRSRGAYPTELARREMALERLCIIAIDILDIIS